MVIVCSHCKKSYEIPDDRLRKLGSDINFPCPACKGNIKINLDAASINSVVSSEPSSQAEEVLLTGEALKKKILRTVGDLPPMPQVAQKARKVTADEHSSFKDLADVIETDQAIATRVLKLANSSYYGQAGKVTSIQQASVVLGMKTLNEILMMACAGSMVGSELEGYRLQSGDLWLHSLATAGCARMIAEEKKPALADDAFSAGLIHDCGKLILNQYIAERHTQFDELLEDGQKTFLEAEKELLGFDHALIAAEVCAKWQIPFNLIIPIKQHHNPGASNGNELVNIVHVADSIALMSGIGAGRDGMMYVMDDRALESLGLDSDQVGEYIGRTAEYVSKTASAF